MRWRASSSERETGGRQAGVGDGVAVHPWRREDLVVETVAGRRQDRGERAIGVGVGARQTDLQMTPGTGADDADRARAVVVSSAVVHRRARVWGEPLVGVGRRGPERGEIGYRGQESADDMQSCLGQVRPVTAEERLLLFGVVEGEVDVQAAADSGVGRVDDPEPHLGVAVAESPTAIRSSEDRQQRPAKAERTT
jgi:hypothetical protein